MRKKEKKSDPEKKKEKKKGDTIATLDQKKKIATQIPKKKHNRPKNREGYTRHKF